MADTKAVERDFQTELKEAQASVKELGARRDKLVGDVRVEESRVAAAVEALTALGIKDAAKLSVAELTELRNTTQSDLETNLDTLKAQIVAGKDLMAKYDAAAA